MTHRCKLPRHVQNTVSWSVLGELLAQFTFRTRTWEWSPGIIVLFSFLKHISQVDPNGLCLLRTTDSSTRLYGWNRKHALAKSQLTCFFRIANYPFPGVFFFFSFLLPSISHNFISSLPPTRTYSYDDSGVTLAPDLYVPLEISSSWIQFFRSLRLLKKSQRARSSGWVI